MEIGCAELLLALLLRVGLRLLRVLVGRVGVDGVGVLVALAAAQRVDALGHDVHLEVRARHRRLLARRRLLLFLLVLLDGLDDLLDRLDDLLNRLRRDRCGLDRVGLDLRSHGGLGGRLHDLGLGLGLGLLDVLPLRGGCGLLVVCHQASISSGCGFWATCGCSGPA